MSDETILPPPSGDPVKPKQSHKKQGTDEAPDNQESKQGAEKVPSTSLPGEPLAAPKEPPTQPPVGDAVSLASPPPSGGVMPTMVPAPSGGHYSATTPQDAAGISGPAGFAPAAVKKRSKKPLVITLVAVLAVILIVLGVLVFQEVSRSNAYDQAMTQYDQGEYQAARDGFAELGDYKDAEEMYRLSTLYLNYEAAIALYESGDYDAAYTEFNLLLSSSISDIADWIDKVEYAQADELFTEGDLEGAYKAFLALGSYSDSAERATACTQPFPATGVLWQAEGSHYEFCALDIDYRYSSGGAYYKVYSGATLMATLFVNANSTARVHLQPGTYTVKEGSGDVWFGETLAFGKAGWYSTMTYDDTGTDYFTLNDGDLVTITINTDSAGNITERGEDLSTF